MATAVAFSAAPAAGKSASQLAKDGDKAERAGDTVLAYRLYLQAASLDRLNLDYWTKVRTLRRKLPAASFQVELAKPALGPGAEPPPESESAAASGKLTVREQQEFQELAGPVSLEPAPGTRDFKLKTRTRTLFEEVARAYGLIAIFERDYPDEDRTIKFEIAGADAKEALYAVQRATNSFIVPVSKRILLVSVDTAQKRQDYEPTVARVFEIPQRTSPQEAQEMLSLIQQSLDVRRAILDPQKRQILLRDRAAKVEVAAALLKSLLNYKAQVSVEVELIALSESSSLNAGIGLPTSFPIVNFGRNLLPDVVWDRPKFAGGYLPFGGGTTLLGLGIANAELFASVTKGQSKSIIRAEIVSSDGLPATLHVGDRYPIVTSQFVGAAPKPGEQVVAPPPTFNFEDLGLVMKVTPVVHGMDEISLELEAEFKTLGGGGFNGIPIINARKLQTRVRLKRSEWAVVAGLTEESDLTTLSGMAGLADVPVLGKVLSRNTKTRSHGDILILIKPKLLSPPPGSNPSPLYWLGTETKPLAGI